MHGRMFGYTQLQTTACHVHREAMISAIIHLGNRDWASLIEDFVALDFLPPDCNRGQIIPARCSMLLSGYLTGNGL